MKILPGEKSYRNQKVRNEGGIGHYLYNQANYQLDRKER
jgi:hypothetical protein